MTIDQILEENLKLIDETYVFIENIINELEMVVDVNYKNIPIDPVRNDMY